MRSAKKIQINDIVFAIGIFALAIFSFWKASYGADGYDEAFYLTIPYRMVNGDILFLNEWHGSQLSAFLLYPFVKLYLTVFKSTEGIILAFRYLYVVVNAIASIAVYSRLRRFGISASVAVLLYYLFVPYNMMSLSYNSMGYMFILLSSMFLATNYNKNIFVFFISGVFFAGAVLCQPVLALFFIGAFVVICIYALYKRNTEYIKFCGIFTCGCAVPAIPVIIYFLKNIQLRQLLESFKRITSDPEHSKGFLKSLYSIPSSYSDFCFTGSILLFGVLLILLLILKRKGRKPLLTVAASSVIALFFVYRVYSYNFFSYLNTLYFPIALSGILAFLCIKDKQVKRLFIISVVYSFVHFFSFITSNQFKYVMTPAMMPMYVASLIVCWKLIEENRETAKKYVSTIYKVAMAISLTVVIASMAYYRYEGIYSYLGTITIKEMTQQIDSGCYSGVKSSDDLYNDIKKTKADLDKCGLSKNDKVLILSERTWLALENRGRLSQYSAWLSGIGENTVKRLNEYYKLNPDDKPDYVYICKDEAKEEKYDVKKWANENHCKLEESELAYIICL